MICLFVNFVGGLCFFEEGNGNPLQYSCLENPMDRGVWWATVHDHKESDTTERLHFHFTLCFLFIFFFIFTLLCNLWATCISNIVSVFKNFSTIITSNIFFPLSLFFPSSTTNAHINFAVVLYLLDTRFSFPSLSLSLSFSLYLGTFGNFLLTYLQCHWIFCHFVGDIISVQCFWFLAFPFGSFIEFPSLLLWYTYFLAYCLLSH